MPWTTYKEKVKTLSQRVVDAQRPIRILNSIKLNGAVTDQIIASKFKTLPKLDAEFYQRLPLGFDPETKRGELQTLRGDILRELGEHDDLATLLVKIVDQYLLVVRMLASRGTKEFYECSRQLYGSPKDNFIEDKNSIVDMAHMLYETLT